MLLAEKSWMNLLKDSPGQVYQILKTEIGEENLKQCLRESNMKLNPKNQNYSPIFTTQMSSKFILCVLKTKSALESPANNHTNNLNGRRSNGNDHKSHHLSNKMRNLDAMFNFNRKITAGDNQRWSYDCLSTIRDKIKKPIPHDCYKGKLDAGKTLRRFFGQYYGDIMYTFDYVLYDSVFPYRRENQFWFLIAYLRILAMNTGNPFNIIESLGKVSEFKILYKNLDERTTAMEKLISNVADFVEGRF